MYCFKPGSKEKCLLCIPLNDDPWQEIVHHLKCSWLLQVYVRATSWQCGLAAAPGQKNTCKAMEMYFKYAIGRLILHFPCEVLQNQLNFSNTYDKFFVFSPCIFFFAEKEVYCAVFFHFIYLKLNVICWLIRETIWYDIYEHSLSYGLLLELSSEVGLLDNLLLYIMYCMKFSFFMQCLLSSSILLSAALCVGGCTLFKCNITFKPLKIQVFLL